MSWSGRSSLPLLEKTVVELEIGDSPFSTTSAAMQAGMEAIEKGHSHYCPSAGLPEFRGAASAYVNREYGLSTSAENVVAGSGGEDFSSCCSARRSSIQGMVFSSSVPIFLPMFPISLGVGGRIWLSDLTQAHEFRPNLADVERFLAEDPHPRAIFLNKSPQPDRRNRND